MTLGGAGWRLKSLLNKLRSVQNRRFLVMSLVWGRIRTRSPVLMAEGRNNALDLQKRGTTLPNYNMHDTRTQSRNASKRCVIRVVSLSSRINKRKPLSTVTMFESCLKRSGLNNKYLTGQLNAQKCRGIFLSRSVLNRKFRRSRTLPIPKTAVTSPRGILYIPIRP